MYESIIIGAGFSSAILNLKLKDKNIKVFDKGRGPGGRSSSRRIVNIGVFDHGLKYISLKNQSFKFFLDQYLSPFVKKWKSKIFFFEENKILVETKYIGNRGNSDFVKFFFNKNVIFLKELESIKNNNKNVWTLYFKDKTKEQCKKLILTIPLEQCQKIIEPLNLNLNLLGSMSPNLTVMIAFEKSLKISFDLIKFSKNFILKRALNESSKNRSENNPNFELWTLESTLFFAEKHCPNYKEKKNEIMNLMISEFLNLFNIKNNNIVHKDIHSWLYAFKKENSVQNFYWNNKLKLGICGDWMCGSAAESAWRSATGLADQINKS